MAKQSSDNSVRRSIRRSVSKSPSAASSLSSSNNIVKTIKVFKNGDPYHQGVKFVLNHRYVHSMDQLLNLISGKLDLPYGAKKLYTFDGTLVKHLTEIEDKNDYVASSNHFIPQKYGVWTIPVSRPFRSPSATKLPPIRASRSQTRIENKPCNMKRSQSGTTSASTISNNNAKMQVGTKHPQVPTSNAATVVAPSDGDKRKAKAIKKSKKLEKAVNARVEEKKLGKKETTADEKNQKEMKEKKQVVALTKNTSSQTEEVLLSSRYESNDDRKNDGEKSIEASHYESTASEDDDSKYETETDYTESEEENLPDRQPTPKVNEKTRRPSTDRQKTASKVSGSEKESD